MSVATHEAASWRWYGKVFGRLIDAVGADRLTGSGVIR